MIQAEAARVDLLFSLGCMSRGYSRSISDATASGLDILPKPSSPVLLANAIAVALAFRLFDFWLPVALGSLSLAIIGRDRPEAAV